MKRNRRRGSSLFGRIGRGVVRGAAIVFAVGAVAVGAVHIASWAKGHPYFAVKEVVVKGTRSPVTVTAWTGIEAGMSLWSIDPGRTVLRLLGHPRFRAATVRREFPDRIEISVEERQPLAVLLAETPLYLDEEGAAFPLLAGESIENLPCVTGFRMRDLARQPASVGQQLREVAKLLRLWRRYGDWPEVSEVHPEPDGELMVFPVHSPMKVRFGREVSEDQFARLAAVFGQWRGRESEVVGVDLSIPDHAVVRLRRGEFSLGRRVRI